MLFIMKGTFFMTMCIVTKVRQLKRNTPNTLDHRFVIVQTGPLKNTAKKVFIVNVELFIEIVFKWSKGDRGLFPKPQNTPFPHCPTGNQAR